MKITSFMLNYKGLCRIIFRQVINYNFEVKIEDKILREISNRTVLCPVYAFYSKYPFSNRLSTLI